MENRVRASKLSALQLLFLLAVEVCGFAQTPLETNAPVFKQVKLFDLKKDGAYVFTFCPESRELFVSFNEETSRSVYRWNVDTGSKLDSYKFPAKYRCDQAVISPNGKVLVLVAYEMLHYEFPKEDKVRLIDVQKGKIIKELIYDGPPARVQFSRDGRFILTCKYTRDPGGERVFNLAGTEQTNVDLKLFESTNQPAAWEIENSKSARLRGLFCRDDAGNERRLYPDADVRWSDALDFVVSADNRFAACSTIKGKLMIWRLSDAKLVFESQVGKGPFPVSYDSRRRHFLFADGDVDKMTSLQAVELQIP